VDFISTDVTEERIAFIIRVRRIGELRKTLAITRNRSTLRRNTTLKTLFITNAVSSSPILVTLMREAIRSSETSVLKRTIQRNIIEGGILNSHHREYIKSYLNTFS
jgi:hypothetical protein